MTGKHHPPQPDKGECEPDIARIFSSAYAPVFCQPYPAGGQCNNGQRRHTAMDRIHRRSPSTPIIPSSFTTKVPATARTRSQPEHELTAHALALFRTPE